MRLKASRITKHFGDKIRDSSHNFDLLKLFRKCKCCNENHMYIHCHCNTPDPVLAAYLNSVEYSIKSLAVMILPKLNQIGWEK